MVLQPVLNILAEAHIKTPVLLAMEDINKIHPKIVAIRD